MADFEPPAAAAPIERIREEMDARRLVSNGIDGTRGEYLLAPLTPAELAGAIRRGPRNASLLRELGWWVRRYARSYRDRGPKEGVDPNNLAETGWGIVFARDADPRIREALAPLIELRQRQAAKDKEHYFRQFVGEQGYQPGDSKLSFLERLGAMPGPADPERVPYYLLLVASPAEIPYELQYQLDIQYAVGRLHFETPEEYARYARSVVAAEQGPSEPRPRALFFAVRNPDDRATRLSADFLAEPLAEDLKQEYPAWTVDTVLDGDATKDRLSAELYAETSPQLLFTASHGMSFPRGNPRQEPHQGALLCQDWPGPVAWRGKRVGEDQYFSAEDLGAGANVAGSITFHFACFSAGTPRSSDFAHLEKGERKVFAAEPFLSPLPQRFLAHPDGGALAVVGHVDQAWSYSFKWPHLEAHRGVFESALGRLMAGQRVGWAMEFFNQRYAELATELGTLLEGSRLGKKVDDKRLTGLWTARNDARNFLVLGDPAVKLRL